MFINITLLYTTYFIPVQRKDIMGSVVEGYHIFPVFLSVYDGIKYQRAAKNPVEQAAP